MYKFTIIILAIFFLGSCSKDKVGSNIPYPDVTCSDSVSFSNDVLPIIQNNCTGCHDNSNGYTLTNHANISENYSAIVGSMQGIGFQLMPQGGPALPDSIIHIIQCWANQGFQNN